jgi:glucose-6-phosphate 1-dehydrogenase
MALRVAIFILLAPTFFSISTSSKYQDDYDCQNGACKSKASSEDDVSSMIQTKGMQEMLPHKVRLVSDIVTMLKDQGREERIISEVVALLQSGNGGLSAGVKPHASEDASGTTWMVLAIVSISVLTLAVCAGMVWLLWWERPSSAKPQPASQSISRSWTTTTTTTVGVHRQQDAPELTDHFTLTTMPLTVVIFGATGDLAKKKLFPAIYQLCLCGHFPKHVNVVGYGRSKVDLSKFIEKQCVNIKENKSFPKEEFTSRIQFHAGGYDEPTSYEKLDQEIKEYEGGKAGNRVYFLSVPPTVFGVVTEMISEKGRAVKGGFTRLMIEKPFGRDSETFAVLDKLTAKHFKSTQLFRLDHYLGKEVILNIVTLRWGNQMFEPLWSSKFIESVQITFKEDLGTGGRGGYFDGFGIVRDIMQNHLLQAFMWLAMETPAAMDAPSIIQAKVNLLSDVQTISLDKCPTEVFLGQFTANSDEKGYLDDDTVPKGSTCPTFAAVVLRVNNERWNGVPFLFTAGKGMDERLCEIRIRFKLQAMNEMLGVSDKNELVMRIQPDEALYMQVAAKEPGITAEQVRKPVVIDMEYKHQFAEAYLGDAYERMFLNTARGDQALFVSSDELVEAWRIFTPMLHQIDREKPKPVLHPFGIMPTGYGQFCSRNGVTLSPTWHEYVAMNGSNVDLMKKVFAELDTTDEGSLGYKQISRLARRFFDGRDPTEERIGKLFNELDADGDQRVTLEELIQGAQKLQRAFEHSDHAMHGSMCSG